MPLDWKVQNFKAVNILQINAIQTEFQKDIIRNLNEILLEKKMGRIFEKRKISNDFTSLLDIKILYKFIIIKTVWI